MNRSTPGLPVHHQLPEFTQTHVHRVSDAIQPSHPLSSPSPPALNPSQHQSFPMSQLFVWGGQSIRVSALASFLPKKSQGWSSERTGWISLQSRDPVHRFPQIEDCFNNKLEQKGKILQSFFQNILKFPRCFVTSIWTFFLILDQTSKLTSPLLLLAWPSGLWPYWFIHVFCFIPTSVLKICNNLIILLNISFRKLIRTRAQQSLQSVKPYVCTTLDWGFCNSHPMEKLLTAFCQSLLLCNPS